MEVNGELQVLMVLRFYVDGTPADAVKCAKSYFKSQFDLVISGINWGPNLGTDLQTSGTFTVALISIQLELSKHAIAMSWILPQNTWFSEHEDDDISKFLKYPGLSALNIINTFFENDFYNCELFSINFPASDSNKWKFTKSFKYFLEFYDSEAILDKHDMRYSYPLDFSYSKIMDGDTDVKVLEKGFISVVLCRSNFFNEDLYNKFK